jgi:hypothetical protein
MEAVMPDTSNRGYTYPDSTGSVEVWTHFEEMAEDIDADVQGVVDDHLTPVPYSGAGVGSAATNFAVNSANARTLIDGKLVYLTIDVNTNNALTASSGNISDVTCFTLVAALRPTEITGCLYSANAGTGQMQINPDGTIVIRTLDVNIAAGGDLRFSHSYIKS